MSTQSAQTSTEDEEDFFRYTSGRWLWNEAERLQERYRPFNVSRLKDIAVSASPGASKCIAMCKLAEGGFNKVFRLTLDNGATLIARVPNQSTDYTSHSLASEVATMEFAYTTLGIPVPKVLSWSDDNSNPAEAEYIIMAEARGQPLNQIWDSMEIDERAAIVTEIVSLESKLMSTSFSRYGNIYFADRHFSGCEEVQVRGALEALKITQAEGRFVIGPVVEGTFWDGQRRLLAGVRGPWKEPHEYIRAIAQREIAWLREYADRNTPPKNAFSPPSEQDPAVHIALYEKLLQASPYLLPEHDDVLVRPVLWHWDLHAGNVFVQDGKITDVIDWQDCWAAPLLLAARRPACLDYQGELMLKLPPDYHNLDKNSEERSSIESKVEKSILLFCYENETKERNPDLARVLHTPQRQLLRDLLSHAANSWDSEILTFRESLIRLHRNWDQICPGQKCLFSFTPEELQTHAREGEGWNENADFWSSISGLVSRDGFVLNEDYDEALALFAQLRESGLENLEGEERAQFDEATKWAVVDG